MLFVNLRVKVCSVAAGIGCCLLWWLLYFAFCFAVVVVSYGLALAYASVPRDTWPFVVCSLLLSFDSFFLMLLLSLSHACFSFAVKPVYADSVNRFVLCGCSCCCWWCWCSLNSVYVIFLLLNFSSTHSRFFISYVARAFPNGFRFGVG